MSRWARGEAESPVYDDDGAQMNVDALEEEIARLVNAMGTAWTLICNAYWASTNEEWRNATVRWREEDWHGALDRQRWRAEERRVQEREASGDVSDEQEREYRTASGRVLTDADIQALADEAERERGYDVDHHLLTEIVDQIAQKNPSPHWADVLNKMRGPAGEELDGPVALTSGEAIAFVRHYLVEAEKFRVMRMHIRQIVEAAAAVEVAE